MNDKTALHYILSGRRFYTAVRSGSPLRRLKYAAQDEETFHFTHRFIRDEPWHPRYQQLLANVISLNLLARHFEKKLSRENCFAHGACSRTAPATCFALAAFNEHRRALTVLPDRNAFINDIIIACNRAVNRIIPSLSEPDMSTFTASSTPIGVELEFSNHGTSAGNFFEPPTRALANFSKYHHYHMTKFMWRLGAYVDANMRLKQLIRPGGFLEYTFTAGEAGMGRSMPLTTSPDFAATIIDEAVRFTPVAPHSLHVSMEITDAARGEPLGLEELIFFMTVTGDIRMVDGKLIETRIAAGDLKGIAVIRSRRNPGGVNITVEYAHLRLSRSFVKHRVYHAALPLMIAYKNVFSFRNIELYYRQVYEWAMNPRPPKVKLSDMLDRVRAGLMREPALPHAYIERAMAAVKNRYLAMRSLMNER